MRVFHWIQLVLSVWIILSPWVLGFASINLALWSNIIIGVAMALVSLRVLFGNQSEIQ